MQWNWTLWTKPFFLEEQLILRNRFIMQVLDAVKTPAEIANFILAVHPNPSHSHAQVEEYLFNAFERHAEPWEIFIAIYDVLSEADRQHRCRSYDLEWCLNPIM